MGSTMRLPAHLLVHAHLSELPSPRLEVSALCFLEGSRPWQHKRAPRIT